MKAPENLANQRVRRIPSCAPMKPTFKTPLAILLLGGNIVSWAQNNPPVQCDCCSNWRQVVVGPTGTMTYTNVEVSPSANICLGTWISAWPDARTVCSTVVTVTDWATQTANCPPVYSTNNNDVVDVPATMPE